jgi:hypothetical protein
MIFEKWRFSAREQMHQPLYGTVRTIRASLFPGMALAVAMWAFTAVALTPPYLAQMPSVVDVQRKVTGSDPLDTAARQAATFKSLLWIVRVLSVGGSLGTGRRPMKMA